MSTELRPLAVSRTVATAESLAPRAVTIRRARDADEILMTVVARPAASRVSVALPIVREVSPSRRAVAASTRSRSLAVQPAEQRRRTRTPRVRAVRRWVLSAASVARNGAPGAWDGAGALPDGVAGAGEPVGVAAGVVFGVPAGAPDDAGAVDTDFVAGS